MTARNVKVGKSMNLRFQSRDASIERDGQNQQKGRIMVYTSGLQRAAAMLQFEKWLK
jgi:hypothetical protein